MKLALEPGAAIVRTPCPCCGRPATAWLWLDNAPADHGGVPRRLQLSGVVTDLIHDAPEASFSCAGPL